MYFMLNWNTSHVFWQISNFWFPLPIYDSRFLIFDSQFPISGFFFIYYKHFRFFFSVFSSNPFSFPPHAHTHPHRAVTRTASLETLLGPCFVPQPVIPTPYRKTNIYTGLWAQTKLRLSFIHSELDRLGSNHPSLPVPFHYLSLPSFYIHYWRRIWIHNHTLTYTFFSYFFHFSVFKSMPPTP